MTVAAEKSNTDRNNLFLVATALAGLGICVWLFPLQVLSPVLPDLQQFQFSGTTISIPDTIENFARGLSLSLFLWAGLAMYLGTRARKDIFGNSIYLALATVIGSYLALSWTLGMWLIDDAAITFAYTENLVRGNGLTLHPNLTPEEGYSNTLWMLLLALPRLVGIDIEIAAKFLGLFLGICTISISGWLTLQHAHKRINFRTLMFWAMLATGAPFIVWGASGLETPIQAFLFICVVLGAHKGERGIWLATWSMTGLILTRPETPLIVMAVTALWVLHHWQQHKLEGIWKLWPIPVVPALALFALLAFRIWYFGDLMPNPYYVKGSEREFLDVLRGGSYVLFWLFTAFSFVLLPFVFACSPRKWSLVAYIATAVLIGQLGFLAFSGGDWMRGFRFIAPTLPVLAFLLIYSYSKTDRWIPQLHKWLLLAVPLLILGSVRQLIAFEVSPSTPITRVTELGFGIRDTAERLGIENPTLAHHDAGAISYKARLELTDLAGLGNRYIAKNLGNREVISEYVLEERKPDFIWGSLNPTFSAGLISQSPVFKKDYVRLVFPNQPHMSANLGEGYLSHLRREHVKETPGFEPVYNEGKLIEIIVYPR